MTDHDLLDDEHKRAKERRLDRRIGILMWTVLGMLTLLLMALPSILNASSNSNSAKRTDEIAACRSVFNTNLNEARTAKSEATRNEDRAQNHLVRLTSQATELAIFDSDNPLLAEVRASLDPAREDLLAAEDAADVAGAQERRQNDIYAELTKLSLEDPDAFLDRCKEST